MDKNDFLQTIKRGCDPPVCVAPGEVQTAIVGTPYSIHLIASDPVGLIVGIDCKDLPSWAALEVATQLPSADVVMWVSGTPGPEDKGLHVISVVAVNNQGKKATGTLKVKVEENFFPNHHHDDSDCSPSI